MSAPTLIRYYMYITTINGPAPGSPGRRPLLVVAVGTTRHPGNGVPNEYMWLRSGCMVHAWMGQIVFENFVANRIRRRRLVLECSQIAKSERGSDIYI